MIALADVVRDTERRLVCALDLSPLALDDVLARREGTFRGRPVVVEATAWTGPAISFARFVRVWQPGAAPGAALEIGNVLALGRPSLALPILGADLVSMGPRARLVAADLSPTLPPGAARDAQLAGLAAAARARPVLTPGGELPDWCARFFSSHALFVRPEAGELAAALAAYEAIPAEFARLAAAAPESLPLAPHDLVHGDCLVQLAYLAAHRTDDRGLGMLPRMFGEPWASRFVNEVLFPDQIPECAAPR